MKTGATFFLHGNRGWPEFSPELRRKMGPVRERPGKTPTRTGKAGGSAGRPDPVRPDRIRGDGGGRRLRRRWRPEAVARHGRRRPGGAAAVAWAEADGGGDERWEARPGLAAVRGGARGGAAPAGGVEAGEAADGETGGGARAALGPWMGSGGPRRGGTAAGHVACMGWLWRLGGHVRLQPDVSGGGGWKRTRVCTVNFEGGGLIYR